MEKLWNSYVIEQMARQVKEIDSVEKLDLLLKAVQLKMCDFAPDKNSCVGCHYNWDGLCRRIHVFVDTYRDRDSLNVKNGCCGEVRIHRKNLCSEYWIGKCLNKYGISEFRHEDYRVVCVDIYDEDDFGGTVLYTVKWDKEDSVAEKIDEWICKIKNREIDVNEFYKEDFFPVIEGSYRYINW